LREEEKLPLLKAAVNGAKEVTMAIIASSVTTIIVFMPMLFIQGASGIMFKQLAYVVTFSLVCSLIVALTLVPMLSSKILKEEEIGHHHDSRLAVRAKDIFTRMESSYKNLLNYSLA